MAEYSANQVTITNGFKAVVINSGESPENVRQGDFLFVTGSDPVAINRTYINDNDQHVIELTKNWGQGNKNNQPAIVIPSTAEYKAVADALKNANLLVNDNFVAMQDWQTKTGTVTFVNINGTTTTVKTLKQIESEAQAQLDAYHPYPWAMRKGEFSAQRLRINSVFDSGWIHHGKHYTGENSFAVNEGLWTNENNPSFADSLILGLETNATNPLGESETYYSVVNVAGIVFDISALADNREGRATIKFPPAESGVRTFDTASQTSVTHSSAAIAFASETSTNKVVVERDDLWFFEVFVREISESDPFIYENGLIQSRATEIEGIGTSLDSFRPDTYFSFYRGDLSSKGRGLNWFNMTESQKAKVASNPKRNIYFDDVTGKFYQAVLRARTIAGEGNGDWETVNNPANNLRFSSLKRVKPQGRLDDIPDDLANWNENQQGWYITKDHPTEIYASAFKDPKNLSSGCYAAARTGDFFGIDQECYALVGGIVSRLNKGTYHPSFNSFGTGGVRHKDGVSTSAHKWYEGAGHTVASSADCFDIGAPPSKSWGYSKIGASLIARPDNRVYDVIYTQGPGGVKQDLRHRAQGLTDSDLYKIERKITASELLIPEPLRFTKIFKIPDGAVLSLKAPLANPNVIKIVTAMENYTQPLNEGFPTTQGAKIHGYIVSSAGGICPVTYIYNDGSTTQFYCSKTFYETYGSPIINEGDYYFVAMKEVSSTSGKYNATVVVGNPWKIMDCPSLSEGFVGRWALKLLTGGNASVPMPVGIHEHSSHPNTLAIWTENNGDTWSQATDQYWLVNKDNNTITMTGNTDRVGIIDFRTYASPFEYADPAVIYKKPSSIFVSHSRIASFGAFLIEHLTSRVGEDSSPTYQSSYRAITSLGINSVNTLDQGTWGGGPIKHTPLDSAPIVGHYIKGAIYFTVDDFGHCHALIGFKELKNTGGDSGDDGAIPNGKIGSVPDDNGAYVLYGTAKVKLPVGRVKK